jgi:hypothetical protein
MTCGTSSTIWQKNMGDSGGCNNCGPPAAMPAADAALWKCKGAADISLDLSHSQPDAKKCMSWSTEGVCEFKQKDLRRLQVNLDSEKCDGLWIAPLWMTPDMWVAPQDATGEIDFFERGCDTASGFLLSFGGGGSFIRHDAWDEQGTPSDVQTQLTAYMEFDPDPASDRIKVYKCPFGSNPMKNGTAIEGCTKTVDYKGYYAETKHETRNGEEYMRFVSDLWNACANINCGRAQVAKSECKFEVSGLKLDFTGAEVDPDNPKWPFHPDAQAVCDNILYHGGAPPSGRPSAPSPHPSSRAPPTRAPGPPATSPHPSSPALPSRAPRPPAPTPGGGGWVPGDRPDRASRTACDNIDVTVGGCENTFEYVTKEIHWGSQRPFMCADASGACGGYVYPPASHSVPTGCPDNYKSCEHVGPLPPPPGARASE